MTPLSARTRRVIAALFAPADHLAAERALLGWSEDSERLRLAALRLSRGDLAGLDEAIGVGNTDWRDLLVWSGFGDDVRAHETWIPRPLTPEIAETWARGGHVDEVDFRPGDEVQRRNADSLGSRGKVRSLVALEPEATYTIVLESGTEVRVRQLQLQRTD
jgi:hypothetical protein